MKHKGVATDMPHSIARTSSSIYLQDQKIRIGQTEKVNESSKHVLKTF
jgi:hypothetical protein